MDDGQPDLAPVSDLDGGWSPTVVVPEELTPLPRVDLALPVLSLFGALLGRRHERYKVALISELAAHPRGRWRIREIQQIVTWLEPASTTRLAADLRGANLLVYDSAGDSYRLSPEARVVAAVCGALTVPEVGPRRIIRVLSAAISLAEASGAHDRAVYAPYLSCIAVLEADSAELRRLIDDRSEQALLEAAELARLHCEDMEDLLEEQAATFARFHSDPAFLEHDQRAHTLIASVGRLAAEVVAALSERADTLMRGGLRFDRQDLRVAVARASDEELAGLLGVVTLPAMVAPVDPAAAFTHLGDYLDRPDRVPVGLPVPEPPRVEPPPPVEPDPVELVSARLAELATAEGSSVAGLIVGEGWAESVARLAAVVEAWSRYGPAGRDEAAYRLLALDEMEWIGRHEVGLLSVTLVEGGQAR